MNLSFDLLAFSVMSYLRRDFPRFRGRSSAFWGELAGAT